MKKEDFQELLRETHRRMLELTASKGEEYSRDQDQLANFKRSAAETGIMPEQVWLIFYNKHADAIKNYLRRLKLFSESEVAISLSEPIESRIDDAVLYLILLKAMIRETRGIKGDIA